MGSICSNCNEIVSQNDTTINESKPSIPTENEINKLIEKLDEDAFAKIKKLSRTPKGNVDLGDALIAIMTDGAKEFEQKTGRKMSYAEMRAAYG